MNARPDNRRRFGGPTSIRTKFLAGALGIAALLGAAMLFIIQPMIHRRYQAEFHTRGLFWAQSLAEDIAGDILREKLLDVELRLRQFPERMPEIEYVYLAGADGAVLAHSFKGGFPPGLKGVNPVGPAAESATEVLKSERGELVDVAVRVLRQGPWTLHLGMNLAMAHAAVHELSWRILAPVAAILACGGAAFLLLAFLMIRPLAALAEAAREFGEGDLDRRCAVSGNDEFGRLSRAFNDMAVQIKAARDELIVAREFADNIIETMGEALMVAAPGGAIVRVNTALELLLGYGRGELRDRDIAEVLVPESGVDAEPTFAALLRWPPGAVARRRLLAKSGAEVPVIFSVAVMRLGAEPSGIVCLARDVSTLEQAERALTEARGELATAEEMSAAQWSNTFDAIRDPVWLTDGDGKVRRCNRAAMQCFQKPLEQCRGRRCCEVSHGEQEPPPECALRRSRGQMPKEGVTFQKDGRWFLCHIDPILDAEGKENGEIHILTDVTDRKTSEDRIRRQRDSLAVANELLSISLLPIPIEEFLQRALKTILAIPWLSFESRGAVFLMDKDAGCLRMAAQEGLAAPLLEACARLPLGKCHCGQAALTGRIQFSDCLDEGHEIRYPGIQPHGHYCVPIKEESCVLGVLNLYLKEGYARSEWEDALLSGFTDTLAGAIVHKRAEAALERTESLLRQSQKMDAIGRLAGGIAHDFNNLLTAILGNCSFLLDDIPKNDPRRADVEDIRRAGDRAASLTRQLLAFSRRQILVPQVVDLNASINDMMKMLRRLIGEDVELVVALAPAPCRAMVDPGQIEQVILNLAINARDAMPNGGTLTLETGTVIPDESSSLVRPEVPPAPLVYLTVRDTGCGMSDEVMARIYEPFFTTKEQGKGTGLGLATVFGIIKQSSGEIVVESEVDRGTTFRVYLPQTETTTPDREEEEEEDPCHGTETILLVEDENTLRSLGKRALVERGYQVLTAENGEEALEVLERHGRPVDLLLTDMVMPGMSGRELAQEIACRDMARRTLFMSGYTDDAIVRQGILEPGLAFLSKPFSPEALARKLREVLDGPADQAQA